MAYEDAIEMRATMARWEATRERWALDAAEEAGLLGGADFAGPVGEAASWRASHLERRIRLLVDLGTALDALLMNGRRVRLWLRRPRDSMGGMSPIEAMSTSVEWIRQFRQAAEDLTP